MDKEMMAKVNEVLKANGKRELSMDEVDKVVGGECCDVKYFKTAEDIDYYVYTFIAGIEQNCGRNVAADIVYMQWPSNDLKSCYWGGTGDLDCLHNLLCQKFLD